MGTLGVIAVFFAVSFAAGIVIAVRARPTRGRERPSLTAPEPESGDLGVLRVALDARVRDSIETASSPSSGGRIRATARTVRAQRDAWWLAGAVDAEPVRLFDVPDRVSRLLADERARFAALADSAVQPPDGPFRSVGDARELVLVVFVIGVHESQLLRLIDKDTLLTVGDIGRGDSVDAALAALAELRDDQIVAGDVFVRVASEAELTRAYAREDLVRLTA